MARVIYEGTTAGAFKGFKKNQLFKMANGTWWIQAQYNYWYHYEYKPKVVITDQGGVPVLTVANHSIPVRRLSEVIESQIAGEFKGWDGNSVYKLDNGQVWEQSTYKYEYQYAYRPSAFIYLDRGIYRMKVESTEAEVKRLK